MTTWRQRMQRDYCGVLQKLFFQELSINKYFLRQQETQHFDNWKGNFLFTRFQLQTSDFELKQTKLKIIFLMLNKTKSLE